MGRKLYKFFLHSRLENIMAVGASAALLVLFLTTRLFHSFHLGLHDFIFILLPVGILGVKCLLNLLRTSDPDTAANSGLGHYLAGFFQPLLKIFRDWFPFLLLSACYYSLYSNLILRVNPHTADATLSRIDAAFFGNQPSLLLEPWNRSWITDFLNVIYFSYVLLFPGIALFLYLKKEEIAFRRLMMGYLTLILMGVTSYLLVPAVGPEIYFAKQYTRDLSGQVLSQGVDYIIRIGRVNHDCFPSLHVGIPFLLALYLRKYLPKAFIICLIYVALMCCATIYLRYHYVIDVIAAFAYAPAAYWLNNNLCTRWPGENRV